jgi:hypothetical protein
MDLAEIEQVLRALEARVAALEKAPVRAAVPVVVQGAAAPAPAIDFALIGKSVLIVGGAYVLRALTELGLLSEIAGIVLAFMYALFWMWMSDHALSKGRRSASLFDAGTAALIAGSLIWEATTRFHALTPSMASALIVIASVALLWVARRRREQAIAWISALMTSVTCIGLAIGTSDLVAPTLAAAFIGLVVSMLLIDVLTLGLAVASNFLALALMVMTALGQNPHSIVIVESALVAFAVLWLLTFRTEAVAATLIGLGGAAFLARFHQGHIVAVSLACIIIAAITYAVAFARRSIAFSIAGALATAIGLVLVIPLPVLAMAWCGAMLAAAGIARRMAWPAMAVQAACWSVAAFGVSIRSDPVLLIVALLAAVALWITQHDVAPRSRLVLLFVVSAAIITIILSLIPGSDRPLLALDRTAILAVSAVVLSLLSRFLPEARTIAWTLIVLGGVKLLIEDLPVGRATTMVVALALYGGAMVIVARRRPLAVAQR